MWVWSLLRTLIQLFDHYYLFAGLTTLKDDCDLGKFAISVLVDISEDFEFTFPGLYTEQNHTSALRLGTVNDETNL